jgi:hypothetical protein
MTNQHRATPDEWAQQEGWANRSLCPDTDSSCIIELRDRVEALEIRQLAHVGISHLSKEERDQILQELAKPARVFAAKEVAPIMVPSPAGSLVERVADAIAAQATSAGIVNDRPACAAILEAAAALIDWWDSHEDARTAWEAAKWLEQEANQ